MRRLNPAGAIEVSKIKDEKGRKRSRPADVGRELLIAQLGDMETVDNTSGFRVRMTSSIWCPGIRVPANTCRRVTSKNERAQVADLLTVYGQIANPRVAL